MLPIYHASRNLHPETTFLFMSDMDMMQQVLENALANTTYCEFTHDKATRSYNGKVMVYTRTCDFNISFYRRSTQEGDRGKFIVFHRTHGNAGCFISFCASLIGHIHTAIPLDWNGENLQARIIQMIYTSEAIMYPPNIPGETLDVNNIFTDSHYQLLDACQSDFTDVQVDAFQSLIDYFFKLPIDDISGDVNMQFIISTIHVIVQNLYCAHVRDLCILLLYHVLIKCKQAQTIKSQIIKEIICSSLFRNILHSKIEAILAFYQ